MNPNPYNENYMYVEVYIS